MQSKFYTLCLGLVLFSVATATAQQKTTAKTGVSQNISIKAVVLNLSGLELYNPFAKRVKRTNSPIVVSYVNVSCPTCIAEIDQWGDLYNTFSSKPNIILVFYSHDLFQYIHFLCESGKIKPFPTPFYLDTASVFLKNNPVFKEAAADNTICTDKNGNVMIKGNPFHNTFILQQYRQTFNSMEYKIP